MISVKFEQLIYFIVFPTLFILKTYIECHDMKFFVNISELFLIVFFFFFIKLYYLSITYIMHLSI